MNSRLRAYFQKVKSHRLGSTLTVVATLALGILIGTVASHSGKGRALAAYASDDATQLTTPAPKQLSSAFAPSLIMSITRPFPLRPTPLLSRIIPTSVHGGWGGMPDGDRR